MASLRGTGTYNSSGTPFQTDGENLMTRTWPTDTAAFAQLHEQPEALLLPNAWDAASAWIAEQSGAQAVATSSAALAWSLGYPDGSVLPQEPLLAAVERIVRVARVPVTIDLEDGYSDDPHAVAQLASRVRRAGAVGINLEDGSGSDELLARKIATIRSDAVAGQLFVNARTDVYLRGMAEAEAAVAMSLQRAALYTDAGADGIFVPGLSEPDAVRAVLAGIKRPLNLMTLARGPGVAQWAALGVKRISMGAGLFLKTYAAAAQKTHEFLMETGRSDVKVVEVNGGALNAAFASR
jgi:2-methylisocitrate lyase-like PEP mutase family enzyme